MKSIFCCFLIFITSFVYSQKPILDFKNLDFKRSIRNVENYSLADSKTNNLAIILGQKEKISGYLYDSDFRKIGEASGDRLKRKYKETIGYIVTNETTYTLVYGTSSRKKFGYLSIDLKNGEITSNEIEFEFDNEKYLETILFENRMIMMSATKQNALTLREFTSDFTFKTIATFQFDAEDKEQQLLERGFGFNLFDYSNTTGGITKIDNRVPNTIERSSNENKLYHQGNKVYITFEDEESQTILNILDLSTLKLTTNKLSYPKGKIDEFKNFNSFIHGENFFHIASSRDEMIFQVKNFDNEILKEFYVAQEDSIEFKNSTIIQDGSAYRNKKRNLSTTKQYLRKITSGDIGVSIHQENGRYQISLGSHTVISNGGGFVGAPIGPVGGTTVPIPNGNSIFVPAYNPTFSSYGGYGFSKAVFINSLFDSDFNHIKDEIFENNIFDRVKEYQDELKWDTAEDVFIHNGKTYFSYWNTKEQQYSLLEF
ncbi:hypothetical protein ACFO3O_06825 [Dokdonia ponticola]|uniref:Uncharacterized protein n=1 Tax=Dokdonia ponticola TaxID=2041041 RepID=A0ABV9HTX3_9FLAO